MTANISINFEKEIYEKYYQLVRSTCLRRLHQKDSIEDAIQSTFLLYIREQVKIKSNLSSWFYWSSVNVCKVINNELKKHQSKKMEDAENQTVYLRKSDEFCLDKLIESLPKKKREMLLMRFFDNLSYKEIGEKIKCKESNAQKIVERTIAQLQSKVSMRDVLITTLFAQLFNSRDVYAATSSSNSFILQNSLIQQSILEGVKKMYLYSKLKLMTVLCVCFLIPVIIPLSTNLFADGAEAEVVVKISKTDISDMTDASLSYLAKKQNENGSWSDTKYKNNAGVTALSCLAFLAEGSRPGVGKYGKNIKNGLKFIIDNVNSNGVISAGGNNPMGPMYEHVFSSIALLLSYRDMSNKANLRTILGKALQVMLRSQKIDGGWRYRFSREGKSDLSVTANVLFLLKLFEKNGFTISSESFSKGVKYATTCAYPDGKFKYRYFGVKGTTSMDAMGILSLGWGNNNPSKRLGKDNDLDWSGVTCNGSLKNQLVIPAKNRIIADFKRLTINDLKIRSHYIYSCFYTSIGFYTMGDKDWKPWFQKTTQVFKAMQNDDGSFNDQSFNTIYTTAMAAIVLQASKGHLAIYER
ncbi:MAG: hypothetical protein COA79_23750 [Planctomycetota bacterium]|nr:MAG: hypothetical protein COA79_23750 [Planctomycetota bacterium]